MYLLDTNIILELLLDQENADEVEQRLNMSELVTIQVPHDWIEDLPEEELILKQIFKMGIHEYKIKRAIQLYKEGVGSLGYIAEKLGILKQDLIHELRIRNIEPDFSELSIKEELNP